MGSNPTGALTQEETKMKVDEELFKETFKKLGDNEKDTRNMVNKLVEFTQIPTGEIINIVVRVKHSVDNAIKISISKEYNNKVLEDMKTLTINTFLMSTIGSMMDKLDVSTDDMKEMMEQVYSQMNNIKNQKI